MNNPLFAMDTHFMGKNEGFDADQQARIVKAAGYDDYYVTSGIEEIEKSLRYAAASKKAGLGFNGVYLCIDATRKINDREIGLFRDLIQELEAPTRIEFCVWHPEYGNKEGNLTIDPGAIAWLKVLLPILETKEIQACLYPHMNMGVERFIDGLRLMEALPHPLLGVQFCGYHWYFNDQTPVRELLPRAGEKLFGVNLCGSSRVPDDQVINTLNPMIQPLDEGDLDNADIVQALKEIGYTGPIGIQGYDVTAPAEEALQRSIKALRALLAENG